MPNCSEVNCNIRREKGYRLFRFPSINDTRRAVWITNMGRKDWEPNNNSRLCELPFKASQFESNTADQWKKLKPNAVPTIFNVPNPTRLIDPPPRKSLFKIPTEEIAPASMIFPSSSAILQPDPQNCVLELKMEVERLSETPSPLPPSSSETQDMRTIIAEESQDSDSTRSQTLPVIQPEIKVPTKEDIRRDPNVPNWVYLELRRIAIEERKTSVLEKH